MDGYFTAVYAHGIWSHTDGRVRRVDRMGVRTMEQLFGSKGGPRGEIQGFTRGSRLRLKWLLANAPVEFATHATLTYHARVDESDGDQVAKRNRELVKRSKADLGRLLATIRKERGRFIWIQEFQERGALHFHLLLENAVPQQRLAVAWCRPTGQLHDPAAVKHSVKVRPVEDQVAARRYLLRYFGKAKQKVLPAGVDRAGRFWGASRSLTPVPLVVVKSAASKSRRSDAAANTIRRVLHRFTSRALGFKFRRGRLSFWSGDFPERACHVMRRLRAYYRDTGYLVELAEAAGWELLDAETAEKRRKLDAMDYTSKWEEGALWNREGVRAWG